MKVSQSYRHHQEKNKVVRGKTIKHFTITSNGKLHQDNRVSKPYFETVKSSFSHDKMLHGSYKKLRGVEGYPVAELSLRPLGQGFFLKS